MNGEFDIVTYDAKGYAFYEAKFRKKPVTQQMLQGEIEQMQRSNMNRPPKVRPKNLILGGRFFNVKIQF